MLNRSWVEIDLKTIVNNYRIYSNRLPEEMRTMAVVKANAYGHGDVEVAAALQKAGCREYAVSNIEEAKRLRRAGIKGSILILGYTPAECMAELEQYGLLQTILCEEDAKSWAGEYEMMTRRNAEKKGAAVRTEAHGEAAENGSSKDGAAFVFAIDTGMNRIGLDGENPEECSRVIHGYAGKLPVKGIFTHLCVADTPAEEAFTGLQLERFRAVAAGIADLKLPYIHCMNSAGGLRKELSGNLARLGIILYGLKPDIENVLPDGIKPAMTWKSVISMVKEVRTGETIGYGRTYAAKETMKVATIPTGYADGYARALSNKGKVQVHGVWVPVVGRVCMDQFMADVSSVPDVKSGDEVILMGDNYDADAMAQDVGTIGYEVVCGISARVERRYLQE